LRLLVINISLSPPAINKHRRLLVENREIYFDPVYLHDASDIVCVYTSIIRSVLEYACPVWHPGLTKKLSKVIECIQKRFLKLLFPALSYTESYTKCGLERLDDRRDMITQSMFRQIEEPKHALHYLLPPVKVSHSQMVLRPTYPYQIPLAKASRRGRDFVPYCISKNFQLCCIIVMFRFVLY